MNLPQTQHKLFEAPFLQAVCLLLFLFPLFFQLPGEIFTADEMNFDSQGSLFLIPLPLASVTCFIGIVALIRLGRNHFGVGFIFSVFMLMMLSTLVSTAAEGGAELAKYIMLIQYLLPMFGLVLGYLYIEPKSDYLKFEAIALYVLLIIIPCEMISTGMKAGPLLVPDLFIFSLYQHLQYLPVIFVSLYFLALVTLFENKVLKYIIIFLAPWVGIYIAASLSMMAILMAIVLGVMSFIVIMHRGHKVTGLLLIILLGGSFSSYYPKMESLALYELKYGINNDVAEENRLRKFRHLMAQGLTEDELETLDAEYERESKKLLATHATHEREVKRISDKYSQYAIYRWVPNNIKERFISWDFYGLGIMESPKIFLFGHKTRPNRDLYPSAQNYYLDLTYHFGIIAVLPFIYLVSLMVTKAVKVIVKGKLTSELFILLMIVSFFVFFDNFFKVSFRQPYSGMIIFFLWGKLLSMLHQDCYSVVSKEL